MKAFSISKAPTEVLLLMQQNAEKALKDAEQTLKQVGGEIKDRMKNAAKILSGGNVGDASVPTKPKKRRKFSAATRKKMRDAQKVRWATKKKGNADQ